MGRFPLRRFFTGFSAFRLSVLLALFGFQWRTRSSTANAAYVTSLTRVRTLKNPLLFLPRIASVITQTARMAGYTP